MKFSKMLKLSSLFLVSLIFLVACGTKGAPTLPPEEVVQKGINNITNVKSADYDLMIKGKTGVNGAENFNIDATLAGAYDNSNREKPVFSMVLDGKGMFVEGREDSVNAEMRFVDGFFYFMVSKISDFGGQVPDTMSKPFISKWWSVELPADYLETLSLYSGDEAQMTPQEKKLKALFENTKFFKDLEYKGVEKVGNSDAYRYKAKLDSEALTKYFEESYKLAGETQDAALVANDLKTLREVWQKVQFDGDVWIGADDMIFRKASGKIKLENFENTSADFEVSYTVDNLNGKVEVAKPEGAEEFNPLSLLGVGGAVPADNAGLESGEAAIVPLDKPSVK